MQNTLKTKTVSPLLLSILYDLMDSEIFKDFILVGGTALSLRLGHRVSVDIDLFTESMYGSIDFDKINAYFNKNYMYVDCPDTTGIIGFGRSYYIGASSKESIKVDLFYTDNFIRQSAIINGIRIASLEDIIAMKIDVIQRGGRKKDFWDLHELLDKYSITQMIALHKERYPYSHNKPLIIKNFTNFEKADEDFQPICMRGKYWEIIKDDFTDIIGRNLS